MARSARPWHPEDIRAAVRKRFGTVDALARQTDYTLSALCKAIKGQFLPGPAAAIAAAIEERPSTLWPQWFDPDGTPRQGRGASAPKSSATPSRRNAQSRQAA